MEVQSGEWKPDHRRAVLWWPEQLVLVVTIVKFKIRIYLLSVKISLLKESYTLLHTFIFECAFWWHYYISTKLPYGPATNGIVVQKGWKRDYSARQAGTRYNLPWQMMHLTRPFFNQKALNQQTWEHILDLRLSPHIHVCNSHFPSTFRLWVLKGYWSFHLSSWLHSSVHIVDNMLLLLL